MSQGLIAEDIINLIRDRVDITDVVSGYITLSKTGQNLKGLCPFHAEKTPSFTVSPSKQIFHCFGCGAGGNVFSFVMKVEGTGFPDAVRELGRRAGIEVPTAIAVSPPADLCQRARLEQAVAAAAAWFYKNLNHPAVGRDAMAYLQERGIQRQSCEAFGLGLAPAGWDGLLRGLTKEGFTLSDLSMAGLVVAKDQTSHRSQDAGGYYDRFRSRVMVPIFDLHKKAIGFGGRILGEGEPKYLNSPETPLFNKGRTLYGLERAREAAGRLNQLILVEGYFDAIALHQTGITNATATLGTALTPDHLRIIRRFVSKVVLLFDPDAAGVRASLRTLDIFVDSGVGVTVVTLPEGQDPDTFVRTHGAPAFARLVERAPSLLDFAVEHSLRNASGSMDDRIRSVDDILMILQKTGNRIEKEECLRRVAERLGISQQRLVERYPELLPKRAHSGAKKLVVAGESRSKRHPEEWDLVYFLLQGQLNAAQIRDLHVDAFTVPICRRIVQIALGHVDRNGGAQIRPLLDEALADPDCKSVVTELSMEDRHFDDVREHANGCLEMLERKRREQMLSELIIRLRAAEKEGRIDEARQLNAQVNDLRMMKAGVPSFRAT